MRGLLVGLRRCDVKVVLGGWGISGCGSCGVFFVLRAEKTVRRELLLENNMGSFYGKNLFQSYSVSYGIKP